MRDGARLLPLVAEALLCQLLCSSLPPRQSGRIPGMKFENKLRNKTLEKDSNRSMSQIKRSPEIHDVVVIGSGAGGGTVAHVLTALGIRVTMLEAGPMLDPAKEFKEHQWPHEVDHRGAEEGGAAYFGRGKPFGYFT